MIFTHKTPKNMYNKTALKTHVFYFNCILSLLCFVITKIRIQCKTRRFIKLSERGLFSFEIGKMCCLFTEHLTGLKTNTENATKLFFITGCPVTWARCWWNHMSTSNNHTSAVFCEQESAGALRNHVMNLIQIIFILTLVWRVWVPGCPQLDDEKRRPTDSVDQHYDQSHPYCLWHGLRNARGRWWGRIW